MKTKWLQVTLLMLTMALVGTAAADPLNQWNNGTVGDWNNPANWSQGYVPDTQPPTVDGRNAQLGGAASVATVSDDAEFGNTSGNTDFYGPEWGATLNVDGASLTHYGFAFAPIGGSEAERTFINVRNGGQLNVTNLLIGDNWWFVRPYVTLNVYDTSTVSASDFIWLGGVLNIYGGSVTAPGMNVAAFTHESAEPYIGLGLTQLNIEGGELIIGADYTTQVNDWIAAGYLTAYGLAPGRGADIIVDTASITGSTIVSAVYNYPAANPVPADGSTGAGTAVSAELVDVTLNWWCGADPNGPVNPEVLRHYIWITDGSDTDPNLYYNGDFVDQISQTDPNNFYVMEDLFENTVYQWSLEEGLDDGTGNPYPVGDPNNIIGPIWSFTTKASQPMLTDPSGVVANPDAVFTVTDENGVAAEYKWYKVVDGGADTPLSDVGKYAGTQTATLTVTAPTVAEEGRYYCVASNGPKSDTSNAAYLWTQRLMGHWKFEQNMLDSVDDTVTGAPTHDGAIDGDGPGDDNYAIAGGPDGSDAMEFDNDGDFVAIGGDPNFFNFYPQGFTASFWYKQDVPIAEDAWRLPLSKLDTGTTGWLFGTDELTREWPVFITNPDDEDDVALYWADGTIDTDGDGQNDINVGDGQWHMITAVYDPADTTYTIFTDGDENESIQRDLAALPLPEAPLLIGGRTVEGVIDGFIDDVQIYSYPKTPLEIADMYTVVETTKWVCVEDENDPIAGYDLNGDCKVNLADFAEFASNWLKCQRYPDDFCN